MPKEKTEQQKLHLTPTARQTLRDRAGSLGWEMSEVAEFLIVRGCYPPMATPDQETAPL